MPTATKTPKAPFIGFRASTKLKKRCADALKLAGLKESEIGRVALEEFFEKHPTPKEQIDAVIRHRSAAA